MIFAKKNIYAENLKNTATQIIIRNSPATNNSNADLLNEFLISIASEIDHKASKGINIFIDSKFYSQLNLHNLPEQLTPCFILDTTHNMSALPDDVACAAEITNLDQVKALPENTRALLLNSQLALTLTADEIDALKPFLLVITEVHEYHIFAKLKILGYPLFQGDFIEKPQKIQQANIPANKISILNLISSLNKPDVELDEAADVIKADNVLSYKLLRIVNSPIFRGMTEINSIQEAIIRFGFTNLKKWVLMLSLCSVSDKPFALIKLALLRAIMCSNLADNANVIAEEAYTAGLLSTLDAFVDAPIEILLEETALTSKMKKAILMFEGELGALLKQVIDYQRGITSLQEKTLTQCYIDSSNQASEVFAALGMRE